MLNMILAFCEIAFALFATGIVFLRLINIDWCRAIALAPLFSGAILSATGLLLHFAGIFGNYVTLIVVPALFLFLLLLLVRRKRSRARTARSRNLRPLLLAGYLCIGAALVTFVYLKHLHGLSSFEPDNDNTTHLALIKALAESGNYLPNSANYYSDTSVLPLESPTTFYPILFHSFAAISVNSIGINPQIAENILGGLIIAFVYPAGCFAFFDKLGNSNTKMTAAGSICCLLVIGFPWRFIVWGPLYPNLLSLSFIPAAMSILISLIQNKKGRRRNAALLAIALTSIALAHPNGVFTFGALAAPLLVVSTFKFAETKNLRTPYCCILGICSLLAIASIWTIMFFMPQLKGIVSFIWPADQNIENAILSVLFFGFTSDSWEPLLTALLLIGGIHCIRNRQLRWTLYSYIFSAFLFIVAETQDGFIKQFLCGFWYCDHTRVAAIASLASVPLLTIGLQSIFNFISKVTSTHRLGKDFKECAYGICSAIVLVSVCFPFFISSYFGHSSTFQGYKILMDYKFMENSPKPYSSDEEQFVEKVKGVIPENAKVLNMPFDGSCFAYSLQGLNVYYRNPGFGEDRGGSETEKSWIYRTQLNDIATNEEIKQNLYDDGIKYLLVLDQNKASSKTEELFPAYHLKGWNGIFTVDDTTKGFKTILAEGDMRLYEIDD